LANKKKRLKSRKKAAKVVSKKALARKRSLAAKKGWETRREKQLLDRIKYLEDELKFQKDINEQRRKFKEGKQKRKRIERAAPFIEKDPKKRQNLQEIVGKIKSLRKRRDRKKSDKQLFRADRPAFEASLKEKMDKVWEKNPKSIPEFIEETYIWLNIIDIGDEIDESDLWNIYNA
jgi:hypothetical protein